MINIKITRKFDDECIADLTINNKVTIINGNSGTGKTKICRMIYGPESRAYNIIAIDSEDRVYEVCHCPSIDRLSELISNKSNINNSIIVIDEYVATDLSKPEYRNIGKSLSKKSNYLIIFQRDESIKWITSKSIELHVEHKNKCYYFVDK
jgi:hypothetical protein